MLPRPRGRAIERRVTVDAPASRVWAVLADVDHWGDWNPVYPRAEGQLAPGARIALTIRLPGLKEQASRAKVIGTIPNRALQFGASAFLGLLFATRYVEIHADAADRCTVVNGEAFGRLLGPLMAKALGGRIGNGLRRQNDGLKAAAEARSI